MGQKQNHAALFDLLRSFTSLARTLSTPQAVGELGITRQTLMRHLRMLESLKGEKLLKFSERSYRLTKAGEKALPQAEHLLAQGAAWLEKDVSFPTELSLVKESNEDGAPLCLQQHPIGDLWKPENSLLRLAIECWAKSAGEIEHETFNPIRPFCVVYRQINGSWLYSEIGPNSSFATWFGWEKARSSVGKFLDIEPGGLFYDLLLHSPFEDVKNTQSPRLDHVYSHIHRSDDGVLVPISYKRLLLGCRFPDQSPAIVSVIERRQDISISDFGGFDFVPMPNHLSMLKAPAKGAWSVPEHSQTS